MKICKNIKSTLGLFLMLYSMQSAAQAPFTDDLIAGKKEIAKKYFPTHNGQLLYKVYVMPLPELKQKMQAFKAELLPLAEKQKTESIKALAKKDIEFTAKEQLKSIVGLYGMDSVGMANMEKLMTEKKGDPNFMKLLMEAQKTIFTKRLTTVERKEFFDSFFVNPELNNEALYKRSASYRAWLTSYVDNLKMTKYKTDTTMGYMGLPYVKLKIVKSEFPEGFVKDYLIYSYTSQVLKMVKNDAIKQEVYDGLMASSTNQSYKTDIKTIFDNYKMMATNATSPLFSYQDTNGKKVDLASLRGKYVYIDVWATWCTPCKAEIPFLQKVEHDYEGKNIHFVSLSVDRMADKGKWISYVTDNKLGGIQVMADKDFTSEFIKQYNINSIPRFILIDPAGKIVSGDAKRPSDPLLRTQFDQLLK